MLYSDSEIVRWWASITKASQLATIELMIDRATTDRFRDMANSFLVKYEEGTGFTPKELAAIRKWHRD